ncbi:hypothetical protein [Steroidobacter gossypii]|nr:hypothetical protein [Steroidobacter gossypii]
MVNIIMGMTARRISVFGYRNAVIRQLAAPEAPVIYGYGATLGGGPRQR